MRMRETVQKHFDKLAANYDRYSEKRLNFLGREEELVSETLLSEKKDEMLVLDAGCGSGSRGINIKHRINNCRLYGYDLSPNMVALAGQKEYETVEQGTLDNPPFRGTKFDAVLCLFSVFSYLSSDAERKQAVAGFAEALKEQGLLCIDVTNRWHTGEGETFHKSRAKIFKELLLSRIKRNLEYGDVLFEAAVEGESIPGFFHTMTDAEFRKLFQENFDIEHRHTIGYDSGQLTNDPSKGNFLYICRKKDKVARQNT